MKEGFRATVGTNLLSLVFEPLLEANLTEMLTTAICEVRLVQRLSADHTLVVIRELLDEFILRHFRLPSRATGESHDSEAKLANPTHFFPL